MRKGDLTRNTIIEKAAPIFNQQGFAGASMSDIMAATGLQKGGIYRHFESKDDLALAAFDYAIEVVLDEYTAAVQRSRHSVERLLAIVDAFAELQGDTLFKGGCPIMNTAIEADDTHPALRERAQVAMAEWHGTLVRIVDGGLRRGEIEPATNSQQVATLFISTLEGGLMMARLYGREEPLTSVIAYLRDYLSGLRVA